MKLTKLGNQVWELSDFLSEFELSSLLSVAQGADESLWHSEEVPEYWRGKVLMAVHIFREDEKLYDFLSNLDKKVEKIFSNAKSVLSISSVIRYLPGRGMGVHMDNVEDHDKDNVFGLVIYLNDDYEGGEIYYPDIDLEVKPKKNSVLIHYAGLSHGVRQVTSGTRYVVTSFVKGDSSTVINNVEEILSAI